MSDTEPPAESAGMAHAPHEPRLVAPDTEAAELRVDSVLALSEEEAALAPDHAPHEAPDADGDAGPSGEDAPAQADAHALSDKPVPHAGEDELVASLAEPPDEAAEPSALQVTDEPGAPTPAALPEPWIEEDEATTILPARLETGPDEQDEPTTLVPAGAYAGDEEVTTFLPATGLHQQEDDEATTLLPGAGAEYDEATTLVHAETGEPDEPTFILPAHDHAAPLPAQPPSAQPSHAMPQAALRPDAGEGVTEIRAAALQQGAALGPPDWFTENLQHFTQALRVDATGAARAPQEVQQLALAARDMIARIAMQGGARNAAEGWSGDTVLQPDQLLANTYIVRSLIARGGIGEIYRTRHRDLKTEHAVKVLLPRYALDPTVLSLMQDEARLLSCVRHEAVVRCQDLLRDADGRPMLVMDFLRGRTLSARLREGRLPTPDLIVLARRLAEGLTAIHAAGIIHQDISPDNVILADDSCGAATIIDFGLARRVGTGRDMHRNLDFAGKYSWSSPEQLSGRPAAVDARSDLYSLGLMLAAAARGYRLDMGQDLETARAARTTVPSLAGIDQPLRGLIEALLAPSPEARLGSATDIEPMLEPRPRSLWSRLAPYLGLGAPQPAQ